MKVVEVHRAGLGREVSVDIFENMHYALGKKDTAGFCKKSNIIIEIFNYLSCRILRLLVKVTDAAIALNRHFLRCEVQFGLYTVPQIVLSYL